MSGTSNPNDLTAWLRSRMKADRQQIEETAASELRRLGERSRAVANDALRTIEADTAPTAARMRVLLLNAWLRPLVAGLSLFLAFSGGSWALMHWLSASTQSRIETPAMLEVRIDQARDWPRTTKRSPRRCPGAGRDAPARPGAGSRSEPLK